jgi:hypothetical protein
VNKNINKAALLHAVHWEIARGELVDIVSCRWIEGLSDMTKRVTENITCVNVNQFSF